MTWKRFTVAVDGSHHRRPDGEPAYVERFDAVLKFHEPGLAPVRRDGQAWHIGADGRAVYQRRFTRTFGFYGGLAAVAGRDGWHHIRTDGDDAYAERHAWCGNYQGGRCAVRQGDGGYLHIDASGRPAYTARWRYAGDFRDGVAVVQAADGRSSHIGRDGALVHGQWFIDLDVFHKGFARARDEDGWMHVDLGGVPAYERRFAAVEPFYNGQARVERSDGTLEVIDEEGERVVELRPARRSAFAELSGDMVGYWRTQTLAAAVRVDVADALPCGEADVAAACQLSAEGARRLLRALAEFGVVERGDAGWKLTEKGSYLRTDHPMTLADAALEYAGPLGKLWDGLELALGAGTRLQRVDVFADVAQDPRRRDGHHRMLRSYARHDYPHVPAALRLDGGERVIDAGGGLGALARLLLAAHPRLDVVVLDRPEVVALGRRLTQGTERIDWLAADLHAPWGLQADAVVLARVLHDWDDRDAGRILAHARAALRPGGRLFVVEMLVPEGGVAGGLCDLHLLMATGGRERTTREFESLLDAAGFGLDAVRALPALVSVLVGVVP